MTQSITPEGMTPEEHIARLAELGLYVPWEESVQAGVLKAIAAGYVIPFRIIHKPLPHCMMLIPCNQAVQESTDSWFGANAWGPARLPLDRREFDQQMMGKPYDPGDNRYDCYSDHHSLGPEAVESMEPAEEWLIEFSARDRPGSGLPPETSVRYKRCEEQVKPRRHMTGVFGWAEVGGIPPVGYVEGRHTPVGRARAEAEPALPPLRRVDYRLPTAEESMEQVKPDTGFKTLMELTRLRKENEQLTEENKQLTEENKQLREDYGKLKQKLSDKEFEHEVPIVVNRRTAGDEFQLHPPGPWDGSPVQ